ncbi:MAG TPA: hypothetical protein VHV75_10295 [Solirubrobacteraceae bacterium]|jgi:hypothetical protein|nr:hypothetical protein [Solirubrobacteraceae bacterium]
MVEHIARNPAALPILEKDVRSPAMHRRGLCLFCGSWLELGGEQDACGVTLTFGEVEVAEHVAHIACLERVAHSSARASGSGSPQPENHLASKFLTPSGR